MRSLYIHIPFCKHKCFYCDFNSYCNKDSLITNYIKATKKEIQYYIDRYNENEFKTVYFGGGTPSYIDSNYIKELLSLVKCDGEITLELNPGTITNDKLKDYKEAGINRLSIGLQTTNDSLLKGIGRIHTLNDFDEAFKMARNNRFKNISVDLMFGLPNQTISDVNQSLDYILRINPEHVSTYSLIIHDELVENNPKAFLNLPSDEDERIMYHVICEKLKENGYIQYEISNFGKKDYFSNHNLCYWNQEEYIGIGVGASSYVDNKRYTNNNSIEKYIEICESNKFEELYNLEEVQDYESKIREYMILKLRLLEGIFKDEAYEKFKIDVFEKFKEQIKKMINFGLLELVDSRQLRLTKKGLDLANIVWEEFL